MSMYNSSDFDEMLLAHLVRDQESLTRAKKIKVESDDFLTSQIAGLRIYKEFAETILKFDKTPIPKEILEIEIAEKVENGVIYGVDSDQIEALINSFYTVALLPGYVKEHLIPFVKYRRFSKLQQSIPNTVDLYTELNKVAIDLSFVEHTEDITFVHPFDRPILVKESFGMSTGFMKVDAKFGGLNKEECGLILAASGSGKTAVGINVALGAATAHNTLYIGLEEPYENLICRWYANKFGLRYNLLKKGNPTEQALLKTAFSDMDCASRDKLRRLSIVDARMQCPLSIQGIIDILEKKAAEGFIPECVIIDQMDYMMPRKKLKRDSDKWAEYEQIAFECDELSQYKIAGEHTFGLWVLHQITGRPKWEYTYDDISGFRGIIKPFDVALGIGRYDKKEKKEDTKEGQEEEEIIVSPYINISSLKSRHSEQFAQPYFADFGKMQFIESNWIPPEFRETDDEVEEKPKKKWKRPPRKKDPESVEYKDSRTIVGNNDAD